MGDPVPPRVYRIEIAGRLPDGVAAEFSGMTIQIGAGSTTLTGPVADTAALNGIVARLEALGLALEALQPDPDQAPPDGP